jgi:hypothetical protein
MAASKPNRHLVLWATALVSASQLVMVMGRGPRPGSLVYTLPSAGVVSSAAQFAQ